MRRSYSERVPEDFPCKKEKLLSLKCLAENDSDGSKCQEAFLNFRTCKSFWDHICTLRRRSNIKPILPPPNEREKIFYYFKSTGKVPDFSKPETVYDANS